MPHALRRSFPGKEGTFGVVLQMDGSIDRGHVKSGRQKDVNNDISVSQKTATLYERIRYALLLVYNCEERQLTRFLTASYLVCCWRL